MISTKLAYVMIQAMQKLSFFKQLAPIFCIAAFSIGLTYATPNYQRVSSGYTSQKEQELGQQFARMIQKNLPILSDPIVNDYIQNNYLNDQRDYNDTKEVYKFMKKMNREEYNRYLNNIKNYLKSEKAFLFSSEYFIDTVISLFFPDYPKEHVFSSEQLEMLAKAKVLPHAGRA